MTQKANGAVHGEVEYEPSKFVLKSLRKLEREASNGGRASKWPFFVVNELEGMLG